MADWSKLPAAERKRVAHCKGCKYLGNVNNNAVCDYFEITGERRGCPPGKGCKRKSLARKPREKKPTTRIYIVSWDTKKGKEMLEDPRYTRKEITEAIGVPYERVRIYGHAHGWKNPRTCCAKPRIDWDEALIRKMWEDGESFTAIGKAIHANCSTVQTWCAARGMYNHNRKKKSSVTWDTELGYQMWKEGKTIKEIAAAVGKSAHAVADYREAHWRLE